MFFFVQLDDLEVALAVVEGSKRMSELPAAGSVTGLAGVLVGLWRSCTVVSTGYIAFYNLAV